MERLTRGQAIKAKCVDCCGGQVYEVKKCTVTHCPLWIYRNGKEVSENTPKLSKK
jgi:hypothetical protein